MASVEPARMTREGAESKCAAVVMEVSPLDLVVEEVQVKVEGEAVAGKVDQAGSGDPPLVQEPWIAHQNKEVVHRDGTVEIDYTLSDSQAAPLTALCFAFLQSAERGEVLERFCKRCLYARSCYR